MEKSRLALLVACCTASTVIHAESYDARSMGRAGVGLTMGEYNQASSNPALINQFDDNDEFSFAINAGAIASDRDGMLDDVDTIGDDLDELEACGNSTPGSCDANALKASLARLDRKLAQIGAGATVMIGVPNHSLPLAVIARGYADVGTRFRYDAGDNAVLDGIANGTQTQDDLNSSVDASAVAVTEYGLLIGHTIKDFQLGATLKLQRIDLIGYSATVANFDTDDILDDENNHEEHSGVNVDLGLRKPFGGDNQFVYAVTVENLIPADYEGPGGSNFSLNPVPVAALGYQSGWLKAETSLDLADRGGFGILGSRQYARMGAELSAGRHFHVRLGYSTDLNDTVSNLATFGIGITPWDRANLDLAVQTGEGETYGAALQLGFKI